MYTLHTDSLHRIAYATDASAYREIPEGVAYPETEDDIVALIELAHERHTHLIPRAGGTSIAGQVVGSGIVVDISKHFKRILEVNQEEKWVKVQPGVVLDELNLALKPYGLFFSPETSTSNRCCIGGMVGNNSCGSHSLIYGSTRHHVLQLKGFLSDGSRFDTAVRGNSPLEQKIYAQLESWKNDADTRALIEESYPDKALRRRSCGYAIDEAIEGDNIDLCKLICGSEGTLAFVTEIKLSLDPLPPKEKMLLCAHCDTLQKSFLGNLVALKHHPAAVELMDSNILELSKDNVEQQRNRFFVEGNPAAILIIELRGDTREEIDAVADAIEKDLCGETHVIPSSSPIDTLPPSSVGMTWAMDEANLCVSDQLSVGAESALCYACTRVYGAETAKVWSLRKAGLGLLTGIKGDAKPFGVIEDTAVLPEKLPAYMDDFAQMLERLGLSCVYHAHISTGELHLRPIINIKDKNGREKFRQVAYETALLVKKYKGSLSGEHGDGRLRGEFIPLMYGDKVYQMMCDLKHCWDPDGIFNLHKITDTLPMDSMLRFEVGQQYEIGKLIASDATYYNWKAAFDECKIAGATGARTQLHALMCSIEQCNGSGDCRKSNAFGGTLCPAFKVSGDETKATRARANVLREVLTRGCEEKNLFQSKAIAEVLDSCLACKGCRSECPSNVDMTKLRSEILQQKYDKFGTPLRSFAVARMAMVEKFGHLVWPIYNLFASWKLSSSIIKWVINFAAERDIPTLSHMTMRTAVHKEQIMLQVKQDGLITTFCAELGRRYGSRALSGAEVPQSTRCFGSAQQPQQHKKVYLFADEFTNFQEAELGLTFAKLLMRLGYEVEIPRHVESGRAAISKGCLKLAKKFAIKNVNLLKEKVSALTPLVGIEPSCILSFRDEYPDLVPAEMRSDAKRLARNALLFDEFLVREINAGNITPDQFKADEVEIWLHGHCHQKALVGVEKTVTALHLLSGAKINVIPSGCCGMAGSFGYEKEHYKTSLAVGEMVLFPAVRKAIGNKEGITPVIVAAPGTSCRQQILDGTGVKAVHPIEIMYKWLK
ncbi:MAG: FAD-binding protein [Bacteroidales bacterium]|nr:FAD-binding protein [Bacteroidales bacterium]